MTHTPETAVLTGVHEHVTDAIKDPSLIRLAPNVVLARFETMKVYAALGAVRSLLDSGMVRPGQTLIDSSSGIYALALAMACHRYGLRCHIVASTTVDATIRAQLEVLGATVDQMPPSASLQLDQERRVRRVRALLAERPDMHWMRQYHDEVHYAGYAELAEIAERALPSGPLTVVGAVGTGASTGGLVQSLRQRDRDVRDRDRGGRGRDVRGRDGGVRHRDGDGRGRDGDGRGRNVRQGDRDVRLTGIEPFGSVSFGSERLSDPEAIIAGIGSSIPFGNVRHTLYDRLHWVDFRYAMAGAVGLLREHAVFAGLSTGAAYLAARWEARAEPERMFLVIGADTGHRYVDKVFSRHQDALDPDLLFPVEVASLAELTLPWSTMDWARRAYRVGR
ncbi:pyridoxal-phosphate dependent enzyme [Amycolatopsis sp. 195334CR]|uniref:pyridoxal-phosphate dependent enzyme n=1 Tax=Amycolatopsis sp. 195334CR TaxID=2814588 RepID=UPI001F5C9CB0|nr:pyridoxal-phosphate dependent enzyme [Amycolatopsis sp. 195334CR]